MYITTRTRQSNAFILCSELQWVFCHSMVFVKCFSFVFEIANNCMTLAAFQDTLQWTSKLNLKVELHRRTVSFLTVSSHHECWTSPTIQVKCLQTCRKGTGPTVKLPSLWVERQRRQRDPVQTERPLSSD